MGGLRKYMPITAGTFIVGWLAIAGIFPFAGFWSKDEILAKAWFSHNYALWAVGAVAALLTAFYMTRQVWLVFYGPERWRDDAALVAGHAATRDEGDDAHAGERTPHEPHESPWMMYLPLLVLAVLSRRRRAASTCRSSTSSSTCSIAGSSRPGRRAARAVVRLRRSLLSTIALVDRRRRHRHRRRACIARAERRRHRPDRRTARRLRGRAAERVVPRRRARAVRQRAGHRVRPLPQRRRRPHGHRRRGERHRAPWPVRAAAGCAGCRPVSCATTRSASCSARCCSCSTWRRG